MKKYSTTLNCFNTYGLIVLFFILIILTLRTSQAFELQQHANNKNALSIEEISTKLSFADQLKHSNPAKFKELVVKLIDEPKITIEQQHFLNLLYAYHLTFIGQYKLAESKLKAILHSDASSLIKFRANYSLINIAMPAKNWQDGLQYVAANINSLSNLDNNEHYQNGLIITIIFYNQLGQFQLALDYINKLSEQKLSAKNDCLLDQLYLEAQFNLNKLKSSDVIFDKAIQKCIYADVKVVTNIVRIHKAKLYLQENMPEKALSFILNHQQEVRATQYPMLIAEMVNVIAEAYWQIEDIDNAKIYATEALTTNKNMTNLLQGVDTYFLLYQIAKKQQNLVLALHYFEKYSEIEKEHLEGEKAKHFAFQLAEHKSFEQKSKIKLLNEKNTLLTTEQALVEAKVANIQLIIAILTVTLALLILWGGRLLKAHKRIKELAEYDALTGIYNRGHFTHVAGSALKYCENARQELSVIMFDLDHFKSVNDNFGHACGDWALKETIKVCQNIGRKNDIFARLGGEEFCLLLPSCDIQTAALRAEDCRVAIESIITEASGFDFSLSASFGVTDMRLSGYDLERLLADADSAAYESKHAGRNRVTLFTPKAVEKSPLDSSWSITS